MLFQLRLRLAKTIPDVVLATTDWLPKLDQPLPVILMTGFGYDPHHSIVRSSQEGLEAFLFKPFQVTQLIEEIHKSFASVSDEGE